MAIKKLVELVVPQRYQLWLRYQYLNAKRTLDPEMRFVEGLLKQRRRFIDIGANIGIYSFYFSSCFENVEAFEPLGEITYRLRALNNNSICTHSVALSSVSGDMKFYIPIIDGAIDPYLASLERRGEPCEVRVVPVMKLDDYAFADVDLIKIDVEGHESSLIDGALETIEKNKPILIIEIEQRHIIDPINEVFKKILSLGYEGYYLEDGGLTSLNHFSYAIHQQPYLSDVKDKRYVNNFIFIHQ